MPEPPRFQVALVHPEIAGNTGNIGRACMALGCRLHLVHPLGFAISDAKLKRAGMDYWPLLDLVQHESLEAWRRSLPAQAPLFLLSTAAEKAWDPAEVPPGSHLVFGCESAGLPPELYQDFPGRARRLPMDPRARSLNLSSACSLALGSLLWRPGEAPLFP